LFVNERVQTATTHLYRRRMYEVMKAWEAVPPPDAPQTTRDFRGEPAGRRQDRVLTHARGHGDRTYAHRA
jgi:hypothetical protein